MSALDTLLSFTLQHMPDSITERRTLLTAMIAVMSRNHPQRKKVESMMLYLDCHQHLQAELPLLFAGQGQAQGNQLKKGKQ